MIKTKKYKYIFDENFDFKNELKVITEEINLNLLKKKKLVKNNNQIEINNEKDDNINIVKKKDIQKLKYKEKNNKIFSEIFNFDNDKNIQKESIKKESLKKESLKKEIKINKKKQNTNKLDIINKLDKLDKSEKSEKSEKINKSEKSEKINESEKSEKINESEKSEKNTCDNNIKHDENKILNISPLIKNQVIWYSDELDSDELEQKFKNKFPELKKFIPENLIEDKNDINDKEE
jgi:hypothetical protein